MIISEIKSYLVKNKKEITTTGVGVIETLALIEHSNENLIFRIDFKFCLAAKFKINPKNQLGLGTSEKC